MWRWRCGPTAIIGASVSTVDEAVEAEAEGASYLGVGCMYTTQSKADAGDPLGPERLREIRAVVNIPWWLSAASPARISRN